ncbi:hypothetical protein MSAN_00816200 [Mycena sanguinolenta]|uniref:Uncharacterized protein n=1 Tax=Mycena sanguinolenta TaxID=230812 RepID=A0A8H6YYH1_9AGAR|nr:hypothetical protein MSAN_00816200 [Mycena sanguinolenta]
MPLKKGRAKAKNLGHYAVKRKAANFPASAEEQPSKRARSGSPSGCNPDDSRANVDEPTAVHVKQEETDNLELESEANTKIEIYDEQSIPHPQDHADLDHWLKLPNGPQSSESLHTSAGPARRGPYHNTKIGKEISTRRARELRRVGEREEGKGKQGGRAAWSEEK